MTRSTRVLAHPDGSYTVEMLMDVMLVDRAQELAIPKRVKQWALDPGYAVQPGSVGQHRVLATALYRAEELSTCDDTGLYARVIHAFTRDEDQQASGTIQ